AAKTEEGVPCVAYIGPEASGHYVKMVHNGMEYGIMQIICEVYDVLRTVGNCTNEQMSEIFEKWDEGQLHSYLTEITSKVLKQRDDL
ncbi:NADP-dependent phosphogluconate dehydrogenase, partial [Enterococcus faecalis]